MGDKPANDLERLILKAYNDGKAGRVPPFMQKGSYCPNCKFPLTFGRHRFPAVLGGRQVLVCEPVIAPTAEIEQLRQRAGLYQEIASAALANDNEALRVLIDKIRRMKREGMQL